LSGEKDVVRILRRLFLIAGAAVAAIPVLVAAAFLAAYIPASARVSAELAELPPQLRPPPDVFFEAAICVHHHGVSHLAARKLLTADGLNQTRAITWAARYFIWTQAVERRPAADGMALFANSIRHKAGSGLLSGARAYFSNELAELTRAEALELVLADYTSSPNSKHVESLRRSCSYARRPTSR
jgi:hypothetical protein